MKANIRLAPVCFALAGFVLIGCGQKDERVDASASLASDRAQSETAVAAIFGEAMDSMSDTNMSSDSGSSLSLAAVGGDVEVTMERSCEAIDDQAVVTITRDKTMSWERSNARISISASSNIENDIIRTWSKDGGAVACALNGKAAAIDFEADLTGYELNVVIKRLVSREMTRTLTRTDETTTRSLKSTVEGTRQAKWLSQATEDDGSISRNKSVSFNVTRTDNFVAKDGSVKDLQLTVETKEDLQVTVNWDNLTRERQLLSKLITAGTIKATQSSDSYLEASFSNILMKFDDSTCSVVSGSMEAKIFGEGSTEATKVYTLTALDGTITVKDVTDPVNPEDVEDFDYSPCDLKDFSYY